MKNIMAALFFLISWQEYELKPTYANPPREFILDWDKPEPPEYYTVETVEKSIKLKTQKDVDLFVGEEHVIYHDYNNGVRAIEQLPRKIGIIGPNAFNIKVKEIEK